MPLRRVVVRDRSGTHRDEYFFTTNAAPTPVAVVGYYTGRWNIETTVEGLRARVGLETPRGWCPATVLCAAPRLFGLYTVVAIPFTALPEAKRRGAVLWTGKEGVTFSDALAVVWRWLWSEWVFPQAAGGAAVENSPNHCGKSFSPPSPQMHNLHQSSLAPLDVPRQFRRRRRLDRHGGAVRRGR